MAILGEAHIIVRAITDGVNDDIKRAFDNAGVNDNIRKNTKAMKSNAGEALALAQAFHKLNRVGMTMQGGFGAILGALQTLVSGGIIPLIATLGQAATAGVAMVGVFAAIKVGTMVAKSAMKGISQAVSASATGNSAYTKTLREVREEMQQLAFDAEDAALGEKRAALNLEKAREELMRVQDLPPNSRARREAELAYEEADLAFRRAKDRNSDLQEEINNPKKKGGGGAGTDPFKDLTKSQKELAKYLVSVKGQMKDLREAAASGFLPMLQTQISRLLKGPTWKTLLVGYNEVGVSLGEAAKNFVDALTKGNNLSNLKEFFRTTANVLPKLGSVLGSVFGVFLGVMKAAAPLIRRFTTWLAKAADHLDKVVALKANSGQLTKFFDRAGTMAGQFVRIFKNWFSGLGAMFGSAVGPGSGGQKLLDWLERASKRYKDARTSFSGRLLNEKSLSRSADNFITMGAALGKIAHAFKGLGEAGATAAFTEIAKAAPYIHEILINAVRTGKAFGRVVAAVIKLISAFSDAGQASTFLDVIANTLNFIANIMKAIQPFLNFVGPIFGMIAAFAVLGGWLGKVMLLFKGFAIQIAIGQARMRGMSAETAIQTTMFKKLGITAEVAGKQMKGAMAGNIFGLALLGAIELFSWAQSMVDSNNQKITDSATKAFEVGRTGAEALQAAFREIDFSGSWVEEYLYTNNMNVAVSKAHDLTGGLSDLKVALDGIDYGKSGAGLEDYENGLEQFGHVLTDMVGTDLEKAQAAFKSIGDTYDLSTKQQLTMLNQMPDFRDALVTQAGALGINLRDLNGNVDAMRALAFANGEGEIALMRAAAAAKEFQAKIAGAAAEVINMGDAVKDATDKNGKVNVEKLIGNLKKQSEDAAKYYTNLLKLQGKGVGQPVIDAIIGMGAKEGSAAAAALVAATPKQLKTLQAQYSEVGNLTSTEMAEKLAEAQPAITQAFTKLGEAGMNAFIAALVAGKSIKEAMVEVVRQMNESQSKLIYSADASGTLHAKDAKTGKYVFAKGGLVAPRRLSAGTRNPLQGFGGPQADTIPAYLSAGEFVMNASAVSRFLPTLQAMNQTSMSNNRLNSTVPAAQALTPPSNNVQIVVNPAPGMNETELAKRVAIEMARQMRLGAV